MKRIIVFLLASAFIMLFFALVYALVFAKPDSAFWKYRLVIGIFFIVVTRFVLMAYRRSRIMHS